MDTSSPPAVPFEFHGRAGEYFGIWSVSLCLTVLTLGVYGPWAKVRRKRYFYGSTRLAGASFDYVADPAAILKGRLLALGLVLPLGAALQWWPGAEPFAGLAFLAALPWLIIRGRRFNAANTVYRGLRFGFDAPYAEGLVNFVALPLVVVPLTLGLAYPWLLWRQKKFLVERHSYGASPFRLDLGPGAFWPVFLALGLAAAGLGAAAWGIAALLPRPAAGGLAALFLVLFSLASMIYLDVAMSNLVLSNVSIGGAGLRCRLGFSRMAFLYLTNALGVALSLGLLVPWAAVRMARYRLESLAWAGGEERLEGFLAGRRAAAGAFGEELGDLLNVELGL